MTSCVDARSSNGSGMSQVMSGDAVGVGFDAEMCEAVMRVAPSYRMAVALNRSIESGASVVEAGLALRRP
jgi:thiazole synthase ThiGH ThiG subunit